MLHRRLKILFRAYNFIIRSITRSLIVFEKPRKKSLVVIFVVSLKMIKLLVILFFIVEEVSLVLNISGFRIRQGWRVFISRKNIPVK